MMKKNQRPTERGQAIVLIAMAIIALIAVIGLMLDGGILFIEYARLKRAIDSASVAAALQYRQGFTNNQLQQHLVDAATEFLRLNQSDVSNITVDTYLNDPTLVTSPQRKLVRVTATRHVTFGFMRLFGFTGTDITANSVGEAASVDMVLVIDTSGSMAYETADHPLLNADPTGADATPNSADASDDPSLCNQNLTDLCTAQTCPCQPLWSVKSAAIALLDTLFFPYDRVSVVTMTNRLDAGNAITRDPVVKLPLTSVQADVETALQTLKVYEPPSCSTNPTVGSCLHYNAQNKFDYVDCPAYNNSNPKNPSTCGSSNVGGAMLLAGDQFAQTPIREDSLWIVIALVGGPVNATETTLNPPNGYCPQTTWNSAFPFCRDADLPSITRHCSSGAAQAPCEAAGGVYDPDNYDADDYARDRTDFVADPNIGQGATVFTIGLGNLIRNAPKGDPYSAENLLTYMAVTSGGLTANHGFYSYAPNADGLAAIFQKIADNIFTRISQ